MVGHITYLSDASMQKKFGRVIQQEEADIDRSPNFQVESYLNHQGDTFTKRFDANSYLYITKAVDFFDLSKNGSLIEGFAGVTAKYLVISITSDWLYPPYQSQEIVSALTANGVDAKYEEIRSQYGHDAFLLEEGQLNYLIRGFLSQILVSDIMNQNFYSVSRDETIENASILMVKKKVSHLPVVSENGKLEGIVTSWDITKAVACKITELNEIITRDVKYVHEGERIETASSTMEKYSISALPVIDSENRIIGMVTSESISALIGRFS